MRDGFLRVAGAVPKHRLERALRVVNLELGADRRGPVSVPFFSRIRQEPELMDFLYKTELWGLCESLIGPGAVRPSMANVTLAFPAAAGAPPHDDADFHVDGIPSPGERDREPRTFTLFVCVLLKDLPRPLSGNFKVVPGSHLEVSRLVARGGVDSLRGALRGRDFPEARQFTGRAGDAMICHHHLLHARERNESPDIRYAVFFRVEHAAHRSRWREAMADPWLDFEGLRGGGSPPPAAAPASRAADAAAPGLDAARLLSDRGLVLEAIEAATRAAEAAPSDAGPRLLRARFHLQRRNYAEAEADLEASSRLAPGSPEPARLRAELLCLTDRAEQAERELAAALRRGPEDDALRAELARVRVQLGRAAARGDVARLSRSADPRARAEAAFLRGALAFRLRRPGLGAADFRALIASLGEDDPLAQRARFYWTASRAADPAFLRRIGMKTSKKKATGPRLSLCGLGIFPPYTASLAVLHEIGRSDVAFNNVAGPETRQLLAQFCAKVRPASYQAWQDEPKWADAIFAELDKGRRVAFVTRGHPLVFGGLAVELVRRCKERGVEHECHASVSSIDHLLAFAGKGLGDDFGGISALDWPAYRDARVHNVAVPLLLCFYAGRKDRAEVAEVRRALERHYPGALACWLFGPKYDDAPAVVRIDELDSRHDSLHSSLMLYVPALREGEGA